MNCQTCPNENLTDYPVCPTCAAIRHFSNRADCRCEPCRWMDYRDAAQLMMRPALYLRARNADGISFKYWPEIERWQPGGPKTKLFVRREHVEQWIERSRTPVEVKPEFTGIGYESALPVLRRNGADRVIRSLGLK